MRTTTAEDELAVAQSVVHALQEEVAETNRGLVALTLELEQRVEERTAELGAAHAELKKTNSELMQITLELEDRVTQRTAELNATNESFRQSRIAALNMMEDAISARDVATLANAALEREVGQRKRAEDEIRQLNTGLEQRVRDRTAELEVANKELEAFAYSVSHDLRAPLRSIDGFSRIVLEDYAAKLDDEGRDSLARIRAATQRMAHLIDDLLNLSRVTRAELRHEPVDLSALCREVAGELARQEPDRAVEFLLADRVVAEGDPLLLRVVLENLLGNAWKFTGKCTQARIEFGAVQQDGRTNYFVRDNGAGYDAQYAEKLFGAFQRLHSTADFPGTGIGLATVQRIIHRHGGRVWAEGQADLGATFHFNLSTQAQPNPHTS